MNEINPINYKIHLEPDLKNFKFSGITEILMETSQTVREISLNALGLALWSCKVSIDEEFVNSTFFVDPKKEEIRISLPSDMAGKIRIKIEYTGEINDRMAGFYRSRYTDGDEEKYIAVTQFEESDARRAFPCFDHPVKKATFDVEMVVEEDLVAISNGPVTVERPAGNGKKFVQFQQTPVMSTYLLFFGVGEFDFIEDQKDVLVRVATMPGMTRYAQFGLEFGRKSLEFSEDYYGIRFPFPKIDLIAIADFAFGAMENWGAVTFRENLLLHYPGITSSAGEERICEVIAHEMAHQWFGNLVTPSDWKYLWLNESFATYFGYGIVSHYYPEWDIWDQFLSGTTDVALGRDSLKETFSIEIPGGEHVVINASTAPIIYSKGGSILRQVEGYMGSENFKEGLRHYLKKHQYACASSRHLWEALEDASSQPITKMMKSWIEQPGFPVVEVRRKGNRLTLTQRRFTCLPNDSAQEWIIPLNIQAFSRNGDSKTISTLLDKKSVEVEIGNDVVACKVNHGQTGFYRVKYLEKSELIELGKLAAQKELASEDRWGLQNDLYAFVRSCDTAIDEYLDFLSNYTGEDAFLPLTSIAGNLYHAYLVFQDAKREKIVSFGKALLERVLQEIGYEPASGEKHNTSILRDQIIWHAVLYDSGEALKFGTDRFNKLMGGEEGIHQDIMRSVMRVGALNGDGSTFEWFDRRLQSTESEHERMNILAALGSFKDRGLIERVQKYILDSVPGRNKFVPIGYLAMNPHAMFLMWEWYTDHLDEIEEFHPMHYERVIASIVPLCGIDNEERVKHFFQDYMSRKEKARDVIKLSLEKLEINSRMRKS